MGREGKKELIQREVCLKSNLWLVGLQTGRPEWLRSYMGGSLVGVNRDSRRPVEKQKRKKEKMHHQVSSVGELRPLLVSCGSALQTAWAMCFPAHS